MKGILLALQFLTTLPVRNFTKTGTASIESQEIKEPEIKEEDFGKSLLYFPVIGLLIGLILAITAFLLGFLPNMIKAAFILIVLSLITGGIHLDGFADTCDGFYSSQFDKERILEIMRDSRIGVMGVIGLVTLLLLKFSLIANIPRQGLWRSLIMMATFARWSQVLACNTSKYARKEGKAKYFIGYNSKKELLGGGIFTIALFLLLTRLNGLLVFALSLLAVLLFIHYIKKRIGGMTGDTIGAVSEIAEVTVLCFFILCYSGGKCLF